MKRDFELVRKILKRVEEAKPMAATMDLDFEGYDPPSVHEHIYILIEAGLLDGKVTRGGLRSSVYVNRLTWLGHDFLQAASDEGIWRKAQETLLKPLGGVAFDVLLQWLKLQARQKLGMPQE